MLASERESAERTQYLILARIFSCPIIIFLLWDITFYLKLTPTLAPLFDNLFSVMQDIVPFLEIMCLACISLGVCFVLIGLNQQDMDGVGVDGVIPYATFFGGMWFMVDILLGNSSTDSFDLGDKHMQLILYMLHLISSFVIVIVMLNMLIAIMGDTF